MAKAYGYDRSNFFKDIQELIDMCIIEKSKKFYKINLDYKIWDMKMDIFRNIKRFNNAIIHKQLRRK